MDFFLTYQKDKAHPIFVSFMTMVKRNISIKLKSVQTDGRDEFKFVDTHFAHLGINHRVTCLYISEGNDVVESRNIRIVEKMIVTSSCHNKIFDTCL